MRGPRSLVVVLLVATACGGNADAGPATGDYFAQLQRVSETAHVQERGLGRDLRIRLEEAPPGEDRLVVATVFLDQSARLYQDVVDALETLDPPPMSWLPRSRRFLDAWRVQLDLFVKVRDAGFTTADRILGQIRSQPLPRRGDGDECRVRRPPGGRGGCGVRRGSRLRRPPVVTGRLSQPAGRAWLYSLSCPRWEDGEGQAPIV